MILLDTPVIAEALLPSFPGDKRVQSWLDQQHPETLFLSTASLTFLKTSLNISASPKDVKYAIKATEDLIVEVKSLFGDRIKGFDEKEISALQQVTDNANKNGVSLSFTELLVAATALAHNLKVATQNTHIFKAAGLQVINPWGE